MNKGNTMSQRTPEKSKLEKDLEGKPKITLKPLEKTVVHTPTQEEGNALMQVYECGGWKWIHGDLPTKYNNNYWESMYKEETCIDTKNRFVYGSKELYQRAGRNVISIQEFYDKQKITPDILREIKNYFETKK
jgi:hypothetical protein